MTEGDKRIKQCLHRRLKFQHTEGFLTPSQTQVCKLIPYAGGQTVLHTHKHISIIILSLKCTILCINHGTPEDSYFHQLTVQGWCETQRCSRTPPWVWLFSDGPQLHLPVSWCQSLWGCLHDNTFLFCASSTPWRHTVPQSSCQYIVSLWQTSPCGHCKQSTWSFLNTPSKFVHFITGSWQHQAIYILLAGGQMDLDYRTVCMKSYKTIHSYPLLILGCYWILC